MNECPFPPKTETQILDSLIQEAVNRAQTNADRDAVDTLVFLGNRHQAFPTAVVKDPVLEPVDKLVWMVIMLSVHQTGGNTAFPGYETIARLANVSSRSTVARAIAILRASRWLTLCTRLRKPSGRFHRNVYTLHDEPLPLADALHLDGNYMRFLGQAVKHGHARVRSVAQGVLDSIDEDIQAGEAITAQPHPIERRLQSQVTDPRREPQRFFSFTRNAVKRIRNDATCSKSCPKRQVQNSNPAEDQVRISNDQNSNSLRSSSYIKTTTTTKTGHLSKFDMTGEDGHPLVYPKRLSENHRDIVAHYLSFLAPAQRQPVLDELEGRFRAEAKGMRPVYDELSFLHALCQLTRQGKFQPNLGIKVREERTRQSTSDPIARVSRSSAREKESETQHRKRLADGKAGIQSLRQQLGSKPATKNQPFTDDS